MSKQTEDARTALAEKWRETSKSVDFRPVTSESGNQTLANSWREIPIPLTILHICAFLVIDLQRMELDTSRGEKSESYSG